MSQYSNILVSTKDLIGYITIDRPQVLNALNHDTLLELGSALEELREDSGVRVVIVTGSGEKSFVAGAD
ncbi:MAG: enoyl-CoA hydratase-related protein, partial [bacterium]